MKLWTLGSGSSGNAILVECEDSRILIDCGFTARTVAQRLATIGVAPESIEACFLTHEHGDHAMGAPVAARKWKWPVHATSGTARAKELERTPVRPMRAGQEVVLARMTVLPVSTPHDARQSVGFVVTSRSTGARAGVFVDLGHITPAITNACTSLDILVLESNHDDDMLRNGPYPPFLQTRIAGRFGHLSNSAAGRFARTVVTRDVNHLVLAHLSEHCNTPAVAVQSMATATQRTRFRGKITAAPQDSVAGPFVPSPERVNGPVQYSLF